MNPGLRALKIKEIAVWTLLAISAWLIVKVVLFKLQPVEPAFLLRQLGSSMENPRLVAHNIAGGNLIPFHEITADLQDRTDHRLLNFVGNIVVFVPFGMLLPFVFQSDRFAATRAAGLAFAFSLLLECSQAALSIGRFDVDDLILNAAGGWLGCVVVRFVRSWVK